MKNALKEVANSFVERIRNKDIKIISHLDTDGITSAAIMTKILKKFNVKFTVKIIKSLDKDFIESLSSKINGNGLLILLDLGSSHLKEIGKLGKEAFILDHHDIIGDTKDYNNIVFINPHLFGEENISGAGLTYLFAKAIGKEDKEMANLAVIGMVGDMLEKEISKFNNEILKDTEMKIIKGIILYPATRPIHKTLEFSNIFIPGVTGNSKGALNLLHECGIKKENGTHKSLLDLNEDEMSKLITSLLLRTKAREEELIGNIYLVKFFNKLGDAREISAMINACSRMGYSEIALSLCLGNEKMKKRAEEIYAKYKQEIVNGLNYAQQNKIEGKNYIIINGKDKIKDTVIGTISSILSNSINVNEGNFVVGMAYSEDKIKVSARVVGRDKNKNVHELLQNIIGDIGGECGGHQRAAGCVINKTKEKEFLENLKKQLDTEIIKV